MSNQKRNQNNKKTSNSKHIATLSGSRSNLYETTSSVFLPNSYFPVNVSHHLLTSELKPVISDKKYKLNTLPVVSSNFLKISPNINDLKEIFIFVNPQEIEHYLMNNRFLVPFLKDTENQIKSYFRYNQTFIEFIDDLDTAVSMFMRDSNNNVQTSYKNAED